MAPKHREPVHDCPALGDAQVFTTQRGVRYWVEIEAEAEVSEVLIFTDLLDAFGDDAWKQPCPEESI